MELSTKQQEETVNRFVIENVPEDVRKRYKARCALEDTTMRNDVLSYMRARSGNIEALKTMIYTMLTQLGDETVSEVESKTWTEFQHQFESEAFPGVNNPEESIANAPLDHIPEDYREYEYQRLREMEAERDDAVTTKDFEQIEWEWEQIEARREELRKKHEEKPEDRDK